MTTVTFQQGTGYSGTIDTSILQANPDSASGQGKTLSVDGDAGAQIQTLLAFTGIFGSGAGQIPIGATITSATLTLKTSDATKTSVTLSRMLTGWSEQSSWNSLGNGVQLNGTEAAASPDQTIAKAALGLTTFDVTSSVQAWLAGATTASDANAANMGWVFNALGTNLWAFKSSESGTVPVLTVTYTTSGTADPAQLALAGPVSQAEGTSSSSTPFVFTVNRTGDVSGSASVNYAVGGTGTAAANGNDFAGGTLPSGTITFAAGETSKTITINVAADSTNEANETFQVTLSGATGAQITGGTATGTILNDDSTGGGGTGAVLSVKVYDTSAYGTGSGNNRFGSTDPTDLAYDPTTGTFFLSDSEVDETPFFASNNLFKLTGGADLIQGYPLASGFSQEPTGLAFWVDPDTGTKRLFIADDDQARIYVVDPANPTVALRSFSTGSFGAIDPEDLSINPSNGNLFVLSENNRSIYEITQNGDVLWSVKLPDTFTTLEGMAYDAANDQFFVCFGRSTKIYVVSRSGAITDTINVLANYPNSDGKPAHPKGLELAPASDGSGKLSLWVTDYGKDQIADGRIFEIKLDRPATQTATVASSAVTTQEVVSSAVTDAFATSLDSSALGPRANFHSPTLSASLHAFQPLMPDEHSLGHAPDWLF
jgi:hypothetical protein